MEDAVTINPVMSIKMCVVKVCFNRLHDHRLVNEERTLEVEIEQGVRDEMEYPFIGEGTFL